MRPEEMEYPEIIFNLWFVQDDLGAVYSLRERAYNGIGTDEQKLTLLQRFAEIDYLIAQPFPVPERFHIRVSEPEGTKTMEVTIGHVIESFGET